MSIIIGIDHGYYAIKTAHCSFPAGLTSYGEHEPYTRQGLLEFGGCFFVCGSGRQPIQRDKTANDNYYLLTLAAIAKEIQQRGLPPECSVRIAAGLPLTSFGRDKPKFREYLLRSKQPVNYKFEGVEYSITIEEVAVFPQGYAALMTEVGLLQDEPSMLLMDLGGWTVDLMRIDNAIPAADTAHSLELGMIRCVDDIREQVRRETGLSLTDAQIENMLTGHPCTVSRVACEVMATHGHIIVAGEITTSAKPDVFNIVRDVLRDVGYDPKAYQIDCYIHDQSPDIAGAVEPELAEGEDEDTLGAGDQGVMVGYACNETPEYLPMPVVAAQRLVTLLEISRMTGMIPDIGPDGKVQVTMEYNGDTPVRITTVVVSVQHNEDTDMDKLADLLDEYVFPLAFDGMPADDAEIILNPSGKFVQGGPDADTGLTGRKLMVDSYGTFAPHGGGAFSGKDATKVDRSGAYMARYIAKNIVAAGFAQRCQVTLAYAIGEKDPVMVDVNTFGTGGPCEDDCLSAAVRKAYDLTPAGIIKQLNLLNPIYSRTAAGGHFGREDFPWENIEHMSDLAAYIV